MAGSKKETPKLGFFEGKFYFSWTVKSLDVSFDVEDSAVQNQLDTVALNMGYRTTGSVKLVEKIKNEQGPGGTKIYAAPAERNDTEHFNPGD
jgi:hypothetical protein